MGIKERRTKILLSLFLFSTKDFDFISFDEKTQTSFDLTLNQKTKALLNNLLKTENIEKNDQQEYRLTKKGFYELCLYFPFFRFLKDKWDSKWRILSYEIPERKRELRDRLRREVAGWGLGPWHR